MNRYKCISVASVLALAIGLAACSSGSDNTVLARVNRTKITAGDFKRQLEDLTPQMQQAVASDPKARREFLEDLVGIEAVLQEAKRLGLDKDAEYKKRQESQRKELERRLQEDARNELFNSLLKKELADKLGKLPQPTDQETKAYYSKNLDKMRTPDGKKLGFKEVEPQLKRRILAERQRDLYLEYSKGLKAKAKITIDEKALDTAVASMAQATVPAGLELQTPPTPAAGKKQ